MILEPGDLLVEKANGFWGALVRLTFGQNYQHVRVVVGARQTIEAVWDGVKLTDLPDQIGQYEVWRPRCPLGTRLLATQFMLSRAHEAYGYASLLGMVLRRKLGLPVPDAPGEFCSELAAWGYTKAGYDLNPILSDDDTTPADLRNPDRLDCLKA